MKISFTGYCWRQKYSILQLSVRDSCE